MDLYPYQEKVLFDDLYGAFAEGKTKVILCAPCGAGKTILTCQVIKDLVEEGATCIMAVHLDQLVTQAASKLILYGLNSDLIGYITGGRPEHRNRPVQVASVQSLGTRHWHRDRSWGAYILDECHISAYHASVRHVFSEEHQGLVLGLTGSPVRLKKTESLADRFEALVQTPPASALLEAGFQAPLRYWGFKVGAGRIDTAGVHSRGGEYITSELEQVCSQPELLDHAVAQWQRLATGRRTLAFCTTVRHAENLRDTFIRMGVPASCVTGETPRAERQEIYQQLLRKEIYVITSVNVLSIGFDLPDVDALLICRPSKSLAIHLQILGRGARTAEGKVDCLVLDQAGNCLRHGLYTDHGPWELLPSAEAGPGGEAPVKECPVCGQILHASVMVCDCGHKFPRKKRESRTDDLEELPSKVVLTRPHRRLQTLARQAFKAGYLTGWITLRFTEEYGYAPPPEFWLGALFSGDVSEAALIKYAAYLGVLCRQKDRQFSLALTALIREFGPKVIEPRMALVREVFNRARADQDLTLQGCLTVAA
jgi:superfamily II DNA or RNA helicase